MDLKRRFTRVVAALALLVVSRPLHAQQQSPFNPSQASLNAANELIALPWTALVASGLVPFQKHLKDISGKNFMDVSGPGWAFTMGFDSLTLASNAESSPPGFVASPGTFTVRAPLNGSLNFAISGNLNVHASASSDLTVVKGISTGKMDLVDQTVSVPFSLGLNDISLIATSKLDTSDAARPKLISADVQAFLSIGGSVLFPAVGVPINFTRQLDGSLVGQISLTQPLLLGIPLVTVNEGLQLSVVLAPFSTENTWILTATVSGVLDVVFPEPVGSVRVPSTPFFTLPIVLPVNKLFGDSVAAGLALDRGPIPIPWPPANSKTPPSSATQVAPSTSVDFASPLNKIEAGIVATHMPYNAVLSLDFPFCVPNPVLFPPCDTANPPFTFGIDADSTIWTGHYLAAESFRYAAAKDPNALQNALLRVQAAIAGLASDFSVTTDAVLENGVYSAVPSVTDQPNAPKLPIAPNLPIVPIVPIVPIATNGPQSPTDQAGFIFARSTIPYTSEEGSTLPDWTSSVQSRITTGVCLYVKPSGGWIVERNLKEATATETYPTYAKAQAQAGGGEIKPVDSIAEPISFGTGCGDRADFDNVISRDQYSGVLMGLAYAYVLVPQVQSQLRGLIDGAIDYVLLNKWNVPLPPDPNAIITSFIGGFDAQLFLLRVGATVDPTHVPHGSTQSYQELYSHFSPASEIAWISDWFSTADPLNAYYKYNLSHSYLGTLLFLETDRALQSNYLVAYNVMRAATATHRNAYFNLVDILVNAATISSPSLANPSLSLKQETTSDLADWVARWNAVKSKSGMPTDATPQAGAAYLASLFPDYIKIYRNISNSQNWTTTFPLPLQFRTGNGMEFVWQMPPSTGGIDSPGSTRTVTLPPPPVVTGITYHCSATPPTAKQIAACSTQSSQEEPGVDFLLPYWLGVYLKVWE